MGRTKILVVDDEKDWLETIELILGGKYELTLTSDPSEAESLVESAFFSLVIVDQRISGEISGRALLVRLRAIQPDLRGIILTGFPDLEDAVESMSGGAAYYISKGRPDLAKELQVRVERALENHGISTLIERGESVGVEFKTSARWDMRLNKVNKDLEGVIVKTVAGFLNSIDGGVLLIGVGDDSKIVGLQHDYRTLKKQDRDGFESFLTTLLLDAYGKDVTQLIRVDFHSVDGKEVCRILAKPAPKAIFVRDGGGGEHLFVRTGNSTRQLSARETVEYYRIRGWS